MLNRPYTHPLRPTRRSQHVTVSGPFDFIGDIFHAIPGSDWIEKAAESGAGWVGDFAKTPVGFFTLQVITNNLYGPIANTSLGAVSGMQTVGPQIASVIWAMPGMVAGEPFTQAYIKEVIERVVGLIEWFAGREGGKYAEQHFSEPLKRLAANPEFKDIVSRVKNELPQLATRKALEELHLTPQELALRFQTRPDVIAAALNAFFHEFIYDVGDPNTSEFDANGNYKPSLVEPPLVPGIVIPTGGEKLQRPDFFDVLIKPGKLPPGAVMPGGVSFAPSKQEGGIIRQLVLAVVLTAPAWFPIFVLPKLKRL